MPYSWQFLAEQWIRSAWSVRLHCFENRLNCCEVRKVDDDNDDDNNNYYYYYYWIPIYCSAYLTVQWPIIKPVQHKQTKKNIISLGNTGLCISGWKLSGPPGNPDYQAPDYRGPDYRRTTVTDVSKNRSALILGVKQSQKNRLTLLALW